MVLLIKVAHHTQLDSPLIVMRCDCEKWHGKG